MITVSDEFKEAITSSSREFRAYLYVPDTTETIADSDDLKSVKISSQGDFFKTVLRSAEVQYFVSHDLLGKEVELNIGIVLAPVDDLGTVTMTIATPCVVTSTDHGLSTGDKIKLSTTGALPTGLAVDTYYYIVKKTDNTFNLATTYENAMLDTPVVITTSGSQSGVHSLSSYPITGTGTPEYINYGTFKVYEQETNEAGEYTTITLYDKMYESLKTYNLQLLTYPVTLKEYLEAICSRLGWVLGTSSFMNDDLSITEDYFLSKDTTYRKVLEQIAQATASMIYFDSNDELIIKELGDTSLETVDTEIESLSLKEQRTVNSIVSTSTAGLFEFEGGYYHGRLLLQSGDNLLGQDGEPLRMQALYESDDICQVRFEDNLIINDSIIATVASLYTALNGFTFYPFEAETSGNGYFELGDRITVVDKSETNREVVLSSIVISFNENGYSEILSTDIPEYLYEGADKSSGVVTKVVQKTKLTGDNIEDGTITGDNIEDDSIPSTKIAYLEADRISTGTLDVGVVIRIHDGTNNRVKLGKLS